jgi:Uma2 family endonuclease
VKDEGGLGVSAVNCYPSLPCSRINAMATRLTPRLFTVEEFRLMARAGLFDEDERIELIEGEIVPMTPIGSRHAACVKRLTGLFYRALTPRFLIGVQDPVRLGDRSEPQPDLALLLPAPDFYAERHPGPESIRLLVEVSETSAGPDRTVKCALYARHGIPEVWIVDLELERVDVFDVPSAEDYRRRKTFVRGDSVECEGARFLLEDILGP